MNSNFNILNSLTSQDKHLLSRIDDAIFICENRFIEKFTYFLDERQCQIALTYLGSKAVTGFSFFGGYEGAKRKILCLYPSYQYKDNVVFPIKCIEISYRKQDKLTHRDFLGYIMSLNIKRETIGDILVGEGKTNIFTCENTAEIIVSETTKVGKTGVTAQIVDNPVIIHSDNFEDMTGSVASLRLDCIISLVTGLSREKTALFITSKGVDVNYLEIRNISHQMSEGDVFSVRGYGKYIFLSVDGISKKGRYRINIKKYI